MKKLTKNIVSRAFCLLGIWRLCYILAAIFRRRYIVAVFTYHRITNSGNGASYLLNYDAGLDRKSFELQIRSIKKYFKIAALPEFAEIINGRIKPKSHLALITFDDADSEFIDHAYPILARHNCPSVVFTPTGYIDTEKRLWHLRISNAIVNASPESWSEVQHLSDDFPDDIRLAIANSRVDSPIEKAKACQEIVNILDCYKGTEINKVLERIEKITGHRYTLGIKCLSWDQHQTLAKQDVKFESHTVNHHKLAELEPDQIINELANSKRELENRLGARVISICYPAGSYDDRIIRLARQAGYEMGFTTQTGLCDYPLQGDELFKIRRLATYGNDLYEINSFFGTIALKNLWGSEIG